MKEVGIALCLSVAAIFFRILLGQRDNESPEQASARKAAASESLICVILAACAAIFLGPFLR